MIMHNASNYWRLVTLRAGQAGAGHNRQTIPPAETFFREEVLAPPAPIEVDHDWVQHQLLQWMHPLQDVTHRATLAELCLRCWISHLILAKCLRLTRQFATAGQFTYGDLLPYVLQDDGRMGAEKATFFSCIVLSSYETDRREKCSLAGWVALRVGRHPEVQQFLLEQGKLAKSDWGVLNAVSPRLLWWEADRQLLTAFHAVYRRDRRQRRQNSGRCPPPSPEQLKEMLPSLQASHPAMQSPDQLLQALQQLATRVRPLLIWGKRGYPDADSLDETDPATDQPRLDLLESLSPPPTLEEVEQSWLQTYIEEQKVACLDRAIERAITEQIATLENHRTFRSLASLYLPVLKRIYLENGTQTSVAEQLGLAKQYQVSRFLQLKSLRERIRQLTLTEWVAGILQTVRSRQLVDDPDDPDYQQRVIQEAAAYLDQEIFNEAAAETMSSKNRQMDGIFAQQLCHFLRTR